MKQLILFFLLAISMQVMAQPNPNAIAFNYTTLQEAIVRKIEPESKISVSEKGVAGTFVVKRRSDGFVPNGVTIYAQADSISALVRQTDGDAVHSKWAGAKGDSTVATAAFRTLFNVVQQKGNINVVIDSGVYIIDTFLQFTIPPGRNVTVSAYGAKFIAAKLVGYNLLEFNGQDSLSGSFTWHGGVFDGNKNYQNSPVSSIDTSLLLTSGEKKDTIPSVGNRGILTILKFAVQKVDDITLLNTKGEGVILRDGVLGEFHNCYAKGGFPISYNNPLNLYQGQYQTAYFKIRSEVGMAGVWDHIRADDGSIACHYSSNNAGANSNASFRDIVIRNPMQDAIHIEHCRDVTMDNIFASGDTVNSAILYRPKITIGGQTRRCWIRGFYGKNSLIDFQTAQFQEQAVLDGFEILLQAPYPDSVIVIENAGLVKNGKITGWIPKGVSGAQIVDHVDFNGFDTTATTGQASGGGVGNFTHCTFKNLNAIGEMINVGDPTRLIDFSGNTLINIGNGINPRNTEMADIHDNIFQNFKRFAILGNGGNKRLYVHDNIFRNIGMHANNSGDSAIIGGVASTGAVARTIVVKNNYFVADSSYATPFVIYSNDTTQRSIFYTNNIEKGKDFKLNLTNIAALDTLFIDESGGANPNGNIRANIGSRYLQSGITTGNVYWIKDTGNNSKNGWVHYAVASSTLSVTTSTYTIPNVVSSLTFIKVNVAGTATVTLPAAASNVDKSIMIKTITANGVTVSGAFGSDSGGGAIGAFGTNTYYSDGTAWYLKSKL